MSDDATLDEFAESGQQEKGTGTTEKEDAFGWGSFGKPPEDWSVSRVEDLLEIRKNSADPDELNEDELVRLYSMPAYDDGAVPELIKAKNIGSKKFVVPNMSLLFSKLNISKKRFWLVDHSHEEPALCSTEYWPVLPNQRVNLEFYLQYFNSDSFINRPRLSTSSTTNSHQRIKSNLFNKVKLPVPPLAEQRKIATILHTVDQAIQKIGEVINQASYLKKGIVQNLFTKGYYEHNNQKEGTLRWKSVPKSWNLPQLSEVSSINPNYNEVDRLVDYIEMDAVDTELPEPSYVGQRNPQENSGKLFKQRDTLFARITPCTENGKICFVDSIDSEVGIGSTEYAVLSPENKVLPKYLYHYARTHQVRDYAISRMRGSTGRQRVPFDVFRKELHIPLPTEGEQQEIVDCLDSVDSIIRVNNRKQEQLHRFKTGLMQDLLSGKVRTTDANIHIPDEVAKYG